MTPEQLDEVARSAALVERRAESFSTAFYERLFAEWPEARGLFPADLTAQRAKLTDEVVFLAEVASDFDGFVVRARELGARHRGYGATSHGYEAVGSALLAGLAAALGDDLTAEVADAWRGLYRIIAEAMLDGARVTPDPGRARG